MRYYTARQKQVDKKWHYCCGDSPVGYCAQECEGHDTDEEACNHFKEYLLDNITYKEDSEDPHHLRRCKHVGCKNMTDGYAANHMYYKLFTLCKEHRNKESIAPLLSVGEMWIS